MAFLDDVVVLGKDAAAAEAAATSVMVNLRAVGQELSPGKTKALSARALHGGALGQDDARGFFLDTRLVEIQAGPTAGLVFLGCAVGAEAFVTERLRDATAAFVHDVAGLTRVEDLQCRLLLLRFVFNARLRHFTRQVFPTPAVQAALAEADAAVSLAALRVVMGDAEVDAWPTPLAEFQARLRLKDGGLGLPSLADFHVPAYLAALGGVYAGAALLPPAIQVLLNRDIEAGTAPQALVELVGCFRAGYADFTVEKDDKLPGTVAHLAAYAANRPAQLQGRFSELVHRARRHEFDKRLADDTANDPGGGATARLAMFKSATQRGASTFLTMLPSDEHLRLGNHAFVVGCALRLGLTPPSVIPANLVGVRCCATAGDNGSHLTMHHTSSCHNNAGGGTTARHNAVVATLETCLRRALAPCLHEPRIVGDAFEGPDTLVDFGVKRVAVDVTIRNPTAATVVTAAAKTPLTACARAEDQKAHHYAAAHVAAGIGFLTLAFETTGAMGKQTRLFFDAYRTHLEQNVPVQPAFPQTFACTSFYNYTLQRVAATMLKYTAMIVHAAVSNAGYRAQGHMPAPVNQPFNQPQPPRRPRRH
jgi:hypothetical protein